MSPLLAERLRQRVRSNGSAPLLTYYDLDSGERTELSAISFSNWVDKTSNLLVDDLDVDQGDVLSMPLAVEAPGHWLTAVWQLASWQVGLVVDLTNPLTPAAVVTGRQWRGCEGPEVYACA
ncbi:MAG TPA: TIGR03089 family protein, partial [Propionibacteriaceae bacterium]|nr:TIGR03089 family protein [Propionibacteriaceae bacterium]